MTKKAIILVCAALMLTGCAETGENKAPVTTTTTAAVTTTTEAVTTTTAEVTTTTTTTTEVTTTSASEEPINCTFNIDDRVGVYTFDIVEDIDDPREICIWLMDIPHKANNVIKKMNGDYDSYKIIVAEKGSELCAFEYDKNGDYKSLDIIDPVANDYMSIIAYNPDDWYIEIDKEKMMSDYKQRLELPDDGEHTWLKMIFFPVKVYYLDKTEVSKGLIETEVLGADGEKYVDFGIIQNGEVWSTFDSDFLYNHGLKDIKVIGVTATEN